MYHRTGLEGVHDLMARLIIFDSYFAYVMDRMRISDRTRIYPYGPTVSVWSGSFLWSQSLSTYSFSFTNRLIHAVNGAIVLFARYD